MTASSMSVNVHETYQTKPKAQPAVLSILAGIKSLAKFTAQQDKIQSGRDRTLTATRAEVDTAREEAGTPHTKMSSQNKHPREDAADNTLRTRAKSVRHGAAGTSSEINGGNVAGDLNVVNRTVVTRVSETYETIPRAQPAIEKILDGLKDLTKISADHSSTQSGLDR
ncbi:hypothetical protein A4X09_0g1617 [Tilletia walkeri]|uniref:Uncharacterized protein n=1 Tax=Tilletia walkeri TaxID=117179 RepID=A0A8X7NB97_9BASI|nr:hypothetical protein A4X09_0g1617 [Tilletia walkeri]